MTDLCKLLDEIRVTETSHVDLAKRRAKGTQQWFLERDAKTHPIHDRNALQFFVCGEEAFAAIEADLRAARSSIDWVLWGFDPGMELTRRGDRWPRGETLGDLLQKQARQGVQVRLLIWFMQGDVNAAARNLPGFPRGRVDDLGLWSAEVGARMLVDRADARADRSALRAEYCELWWKAALAGRLSNLEIRLRRGDPLDVYANLRRHLGDAASSSEVATTVGVATHHQKSILIDFEPVASSTAVAEKAVQCGYVMGLNSTTDYWDTSAHLYNDVRREVSPEGACWTRPRWHRMPYRDYAIRLQGEALGCLNRNFVEGWDSAQGQGLSILRPNGAPLFGTPLADRRRSLQVTHVPPGARSRVQIVRTYPDAADVTILKAYTLAAANATRYIYVENQYFQLAPWCRMLKQMRQRYLEGLARAGAGEADVKPLHLFIVVPRPERKGMVPATYDATRTLGLGAGLPQYHQRVQGELKARESGAKSWVGPALAESVEEAGRHPAHDLEALGIKVLVAMLMTHDADNAARALLTKGRDTDADDAVAEQEASRNRAPGRGEGLADDVNPAVYSEYRIVPKRFREIYIHSKLMLVDDVYTMLGSANLNLRSMVGDSELNLCTEDPQFTSSARRRVWAGLAGKDLDGEDPKMPLDKVHRRWIRLMDQNFSAWSTGTGAPQEGSLIYRFDDVRGAPLVRLA